MILMILAIIAYEFVGLVVHVSAFEDPDNDVLLPCMVVWPLILVVLLANYVGKSIKKRLNK